MTFPAKFIFSNMWHEKVDFGSYEKFQNQNENAVTLISSKSPDKRKHNRHEEESRMSGDVVQSVQVIQLGTMMITMIMVTRMVMLLMVMLTTRIKIIRKTTVMIMEMTMTMMINDGIRR